MKPTENASAKKSKEEAESLVSFVEDYTDSPIKPWQKEAIIKIFADQEKPEKKLRMIEEPEFKLELQEGPDGRKHVKAMTYVKEKGEYIEVAQITPSRNEWAEGHGLFEKLIDEIVRQSKLATIVAQNNPGYPYAIYSRRMLQNENTRLRQVAEYYALQTDGGRRAQEILDQLRKDGLIK